VPCTGFYEWKAEGKRNQKLLIRPEGERFFYLAGLFSRFFAEGRAGEHFVIVTAPANEAMKAIHPRMPLIVSAGDAGLWLDSRKTDGVIDRIFGLTDRLDIRAI
jgi:putative SOS response-associated peptidase YedK